MRHHVLNVMNPLGVHFPSPSEPIHALLGASRLA
jgi:hypothetical protein